MLGVCVGVPVTVWLGLAPKLSVGETLGVWDALGVGDMEVEVDWLPVLA